MQQQSQTSNRSLSIENANYARKKPNGTANLAANAVLTSTSSGSSTGTASNGGVNPIRNYKVALGLNLKPTSAAVGLNGNGAVDVDVDNTNQTNGIHLSLIHI